ncbi:MAG: hypothetical protein ABI325_09665 [Ginsengibacter sp.]
MDSCWWALLPPSLVPSLWQRSSTGWKEHSEVSRALKGIPGRADVWYENKMVTAVGVSDSSLFVFRLTPGKNADADWNAKVLGALPIPQKRPNIETATIAQDGSGIWWVAADVGKAIYVWHSKNAVNWSQAVRLGENISADDISCIAALKNKVIVIWSDQTGDAVNSRVHITEDALDHWSAIKTVESGNKTADDHLHAVVSDNGTLWLATKNSLDEIHHPQLVLRVRTLAGAWKNYPYLPREKDTEPSRPVIITTPEPGLVLSGHTVYNKTNRIAGSFVFGVVDTSSEKVLVKQAAVIIPNSSLKAMINDVTVPKRTFPSNAPWLILASDKYGNVYEADLRPFFIETKF